MPSRSCRILLCCLALLGAGAPAAHAAATPDRVMGDGYDVRDVAVDGRITAWAQADASGRVSAVLAKDPVDPARPRYDGGIAGGEVTIGTSRSGRPQLVYTVCKGEVRCRLRRVDVRSGRTAAVTGIGGLITSPVLERGVLAWIGSGGVLYRRLEGGRTRRQTVGDGIGVTGIDHDGRRLVVTGEVAAKSGNGASELRLVRFGGRRVRAVRTAVYGERFRAMRGPMLARRHIDVVDAFRDETAADVLRVPLGRGRVVRRGLGADFTAMAAGGGSTAYALATGVGGCRSGADPQSARPSVPARCRVVRSADPFGPNDRILPRTLSIDPTPLALTEGGWEVRGRLVSRTVRRGEVISRRGFAGVPIEVLVAPDSDEPAFPPEGERVVTGDGGVWTLRLPPDPRPRLVRAASLEDPRAFSDELAALAATP